MVANEKQLSSLRRRVCVCGVCGQKAEKEPRFTWQQMTGSGLVSLSVKKMKGTQTGRNEGCSSARPPRQIVPQRQMVSRWLPVLTLHPVNSYEPPQQCEYHCCLKIRDIK